MLVTKNKSPTQTILALFCVFDQCFRIPLHILVQQRAQKISHLPHKLGHVPGSPLLHRAVLRLTHQNPIVSNSHQQSFSRMVLDNLTQHRATFEHTHHNFLLAASLPKSKARKSKFEF